jgi:hypothetical protein
MPKSSTCPVLMADGVACGRPRRGPMCTGHSQRQRNGLDMSLPFRITLRNVSPYERVMMQLETVGECLFFTGCRDPKGYGVVSVDGHRDFTHRIVWEHHNGPIPAGLVIRHTCDRTSCARIEHLLVGTHADNIHDCIGRGRSARKLTDEQVRAIRADTRSGPQIAADFGVTRQTVHAIRDRRLYGRLE